MTKLPETSEMIEALIKSGIPEHKLTKEVNELEKRKPIYRKRRQLMYKYLCDKHGIDLNIRYGTQGQEIGEYTLIKDLPDEGMVNMRGYIVNIPEPWENSSKTGTRTMFSFIDETGYVAIGVNQIEDDMIDRLLAEIDSFPKAVMLQGVTVGEFQGRQSLGIPNWDNCGWQIIGVGDYDLPPLEKIYESLPKTTDDFEIGKHYVLYGIIIDKKKGSGYIGCPECKKGLKVEEGVQTACQCGHHVVAKKYPSTHIMLADEHGELEISFPIFSNVDYEYLKKLCFADLQPEVIVGIVKTEKYGISGKWILPVGEVTIDEGTGKAVVIGNIDQLDFSKDPERRKFVRYDDGSVDTAEIEPYIMEYVTVYSHFNDLTPDGLAELIKSQYNTEYEIEMKPYIEELLEREIVKISQDKIVPNTSKVEELRNSYKRA